MEPMSELREAFEAIRAMALAAQSTYEIISTGSLPPNDSIVMVVSAGGETTATLDHRGDLTLDIVCNAKHKSQPIVMDVLNNIHKELTRTMNLPRGNGWQVLGITSSSLPTFIEKDGDQFLYGSGFNVKLWIK